MCFELLFPNWNDSITNPRRLAHKASKAERRSLRVFNVALIDWKGENVEDALFRVLAIFPSFARYYNHDIFTHDSVLNKKVKSAVDDLIFPLMAEGAYLVSNAVGREASWFEACYCHSDILTSESSSYKRRKKMILESGDAECPWKGKRLASMALGHLSQVLTRIRECSSVRYNNAILSAAAEDGSRMTRIVSHWKSKFCSDIEPKFSYGSQIPHKVATRRLCSLKTLSIPTALRHTEHS
jgi:hypothetical protein